MITPSSVNVNENIHGGMNIYEKYQAKLEEKQRVIMLYIATGDGSTNQMTKGDEASTVMVSAAITTTRRGLS